MAEYYNNDYDLCDYDYMSYDEDDPNGYSEMPEADFDLAKVFSTVASTVSMIASNKIVKAMLKQLVLSALSSDTKEAKELVINVDGTKLSFDDFCDVIAKKSSASDSRITHDSLEAFVSNLVG